MTSTTTIKVETRKVPRLRFPEFAGEWEEKKLGDLIYKLESGVSVNSEDRRKNIGEIGILKTSAVSGGSFFPQEHKVIITDEISRAKLNPDKDSIIISRMNTPQLVGESGYVADSCPDLFIPDRLWMATVSRDTNSKWLSYLLSSKKFRALLTNIATGTSNSMKNISKERFLSLSILAPSLEEQRKVADFLTEADEKIVAIQKKKELLEKYKKGVIQEIFSQKIRFKGENGKDYPDWEVKKLSELLEYEQPTKYIVKSTEYSSNNSIPVLTPGKTFILGFTDERIGVFSESLPVIIFDDFTTACRLVNFPFKVKSSAIKILKAKNGENIRIAYELLKRVHFEAGDHKRYWIAEYQDIYVTRPSFKEQQKIAYFLDSLDDKIKLTGKKLEQAQRFKKALLQQMFV